ncbi:helix-turn-helix domain-containing protein [Mammaliicoccus vitulinus]|uniref:helix-turn-helix domain-containing protein n=1 Tax=Mammaliicoccus vitulinus TaxID=71237 RepID=UPI00248CF602|nr:helix-turn-helix transcriptional regulator [Mammaliicoccus vitulinus]
MDRNQELKAQISTNIKNIMKSRGITQMSLAEKTGISKSTISDYLNNKTLINPDNVQKVANALNVKKSEIDPTFKKESKNSFETIAAHLDGELTEEEWQEILDYAEYVKSKRSK